MPKLSGFAPVVIPGPPPAPIPKLGHIPRVFQFLADPIGVLFSLREYGDVAALARNSAAFVCAFGPERNREVLANPAGFRHDEDLLTGPPGTPLHKMSKVIININGEMHKRHRKLMMPAFTKTALDRYALDIVRVSEAALERWRYGELVDLDVHMRELAVVAALRTIFGLEPGGEVHELGSLTVEFTEIISSPLTVLLPYAIPRTPYHEAQTLGARLMQQMLDLIARKRASGATDDALSLLIHARDEQGGLSDDELLAETLTLFVAGHETTAKTLTWTCFLLERHPEVLHALLDELDGVLGGRSVCADDLPKLPLLERVVKESMRVLSPVPTVFLRVPSSPIALGHYMLPKGANVVISPLVTHHDARLYPSPRRFDPERWTTIKPTPFEYLPFGAGPRMCVGAAFAMQAVRLILATVLPRVRFQIQRDADISRLTRTNIFMPKHGIPARIERGHRRKLAVEPIRGDISQLVELRG